MSLFQKKILEHSLNYSLNSKKTLIIAGLGNIGAEYVNTRHNIGFACLEALKGSQSEFEPWQTKKTLHCELSTGTLGETKVILAKPTTFMNNSGQAISAILNFYKMEPSQLIVVHDELDLPFGQIRARVGGGSAGHNGIKSISSQIGEDYGRIRIGIMGDKPEQMDSADYVLAKFSKSEQESLSKLIREVQSLLIEIIYQGKVLPETRNFITQ